MVNTRKEDKKYKDIEMINGIGWMDGWMDGLVVTSDR